MFRTELLLVIGILNTVFTATGICITSQHNTSDDGQQFCPKLVDCRFLFYQSKGEKWRISFASIVRIRTLKHRLPKPTRWAKPERRRL
jgi:hypothetical protein